jgi:phospholipid transport system substrate-binding protein
MRKHHDRVRLGRFLIIGILLVASCLLWRVRVWASTSPLETIRATTNQALAVLEHPEYQGDGHRQERIEKMWEIILPKFAPEEIAQRSLGVHWRQLTEEQRTHFVQIFIQLVKNNYSNTLDRYTKDAQFFFDSEHIEGDFSEVQTRIQSPSQEKPLSIVYRLHQQEGEWFVYDVVAENVSMVQNYRNQFSRIIADSSFEGLVQVIEQKLKELEAV